MNRHTVARDAVDTDIEKTPNHCPEHENKDPHIFLWFSVVSCRYCHRIPL